MRFFALLSLLPLLQVASATFGHHNPAPPAYCGTTTVTKTACVTSITKAPAVTKTFTKDKAVCFTTEVKTAVATVTNKVKVTETVTNTPTEYKTKWAPALTATKTKQVVKKTCAPQRFKRSFTAEELAAEEVDDDDVAEDENDVDFISNAERLRRGLPLNKPNEKRTFGHGHPQPPRPSCVPSTSVEWVKTTSIKTVTPTQWATTTKCRYTHTIDKIQHTTATVLKTKTITATVVGKPTTVKTTLTPTSTITTTSTSTKITGVCHPTAV